MEKTFFAVIAVIVSAQVSACGNAAESLSFLGYTEEESWKIYYRGHSAWKTLGTQLEPKHFARYSRDGETSQWAYIGIDNNVYLVNDGDKQEKFLLESNRDLAYTQPEFGGSGKYLYLVGLHQGNSQDTDIYRYSLAAKSLETVVRQRSAQFEPQVIDDWLYYSHVACVNSCGNIIQEIWRKQLTTGVAQQLTRVNSIAKDAAVDPAHRNLYFSSNRSGNYHIWKMTPDSGEVEQVTFGAYTDLSPQLSQDGSLLFIRQSPVAHQLQCIAPDGTRKDLKVPKGVKKIRSLSL